MVDYNPIELDKKAEELRKKLREFQSRIPRESLLAKAGGITAQELDTLTPLEAGKYLKSVGDRHIRAAYLLLSEKIDSATLAKICLEYMQRPGSGARWVGVFGLGTCLKNTQNREASRKLAEVVRNPTEEADIRLGAFQSLILINPDKFPTTPHVASESHGSTSELDIVDWSFVDSFL